MNAYLLTWNPQRKGADGLKWLRDRVERLKKGKRVNETWSTGINRKIVPTDRVFLLRQGRDQPGLVGAGYVTRGWFLGDHWLPEKQRQGKKANYVRVEWETIVLPESVLPRRRLINGTLRKSVVDAQASGCRVPVESIDRLEEQWERHLVSLSGKAGRGRVGLRYRDQDDSWDDLGSDQIGSDGAPKQNRRISGVRRDPRVRARVVKRSKGICEREGCGGARNFLGFLDVHHILGVVKSDRIWNCVALCPNCHREAHYAPNQKALNAQLLRYAQKNSARFEVEDRV